MEQSAFFLGLWPRHITMPETGKPWKRQWSLFTYHWWGCRWCLPHGIQFALHCIWRCTYKPTIISLHLTPEKLQDTQMLTGEMKMVIVTVLWSSVAGGLAETISYRSAHLVDAEWRSAVITRGLGNGRTSFGHPFMDPWPLTFLHRRPLPGCRTSPGRNLWAMSPVIPGQACPSSLLSWAQHMKEPMACSEFKEEAGSDCSNSLQSQGNKIKG